jgi:hypothetical protein
MAQDFCSSARRKNGRIVELCNRFYNAADGQKDQSGGYIFRRKSPNIRVKSINEMQIKFEHRVTFKSLMRNNHGSFHFMGIFQHGRRGNSE